MTLSQIARVLVAHGVPSTAEADLADCLAYLGAPLPDGCYSRRRLYFWLGY